MLSSLDPNLLTVPSLRATNPSRTSVAPVYAYTPKNGIVNVGSCVLVYDIEYDEEDEYTVVGATEANPAKLFVSTESPIGKALLGRKAGETIEIMTPGGISKMEIRRVSKKH